MTLSSTRGLARVAVNPACDLQTAMVVERVREPEFYRRVTGTDYPGEYGERDSARRRGAKFESQLHANDCASLREILAVAYGLDPVAMTVRNFADEVPGPPTSMRAMRLVRCRRIMRDLAAGRPVPDLLIQPQFRLRTGPGRFDFEFVSPDFAVLDPRTRMYVPGEEKSFTVRDDVADPGDLAPTRRQAAAQILALRDEATLVGIADRVTDRAVMVFATPYGLKPAPAREETLAAEVHAVSRAVREVGRVRDLLAAMRVSADEPLEMLVDDLPTSFRESCVGGCIMADHCATAHAGTARALGDSASRILGADTTLDDLVAALDPTFAPADPAAAARTRRIREAAQSLGIDLADPTRRTA